MIPRNATPKSNAPFGADDRQSPVCQVTPSEAISSIVSGRPERERRATLIAMLSQSYADESGGEDTDTFVVGGYIGTESMWRAFSDDWQSELERPPKLPPIHMVHCGEVLKNGFEVLKTRENADRRLLRFVDIIAKHKPASFVVELEPKFARYASERLLPKDKRHQNVAMPYATATFVLLVKLLIFQAKRRRKYGALDAVFDHQDKLGARVEDIIRKDMLPEWRVENPELAATLFDCRWPAPPAPAKFRPLQAADMLAWHWRRYRDHSDGRDRPVFKALRKASKPTSQKVEGKHLVYGLLRGGGRLD